MNTQLTKFASLLRDRWLDVHWAHWTALGVQGYGRREADWIIDLEALIGSTVVLGGYDQRLLQRAVSWCRNGREWINAARLQRIFAEFQTPWGEGRKTLLSEAAGQAFMDFLKPSPTSSKADHAEGEWLRSAFNNAYFDDGPSASFRSGPLAQLMLRSIFGVSSNTEAMIYLCSHSGGNSGAIAREMYANQRSIYQVLNRWSRTNIVRRVTTKAEVRVSLRNKEDLLACLGLESWPRQTNWTKLFATFARILSLASDPEIGADDYLFSSGLRDIAAEIQWAFTALDIDPGPDFGEPGSGFLPDFKDAVTKSLDVLGGVGS